MEAGQGSTMRYSTFLSQAKEKAAGMGYRINPTESELKRTLVMHEQQGFGPGGLTDIEAQQNYINWEPALVAIFTPLVDYVFLHVLPFLETLWENEIVSVVHHENAARSLLMGCFSACFAVAEYDAIFLERSTTTASRRALQEVADAFEHVFRVLYNKTVTIYDTDNQGGEMFATGIKF
jgi:hypothetical protein